MMNHLEGQPSKIAKDSFLKENLVFQNTCPCREIYNPGFTLSALHFHEFIEISFVVSGNGIHRIWNEIMECKKGDMYILNRGVPHGYFAKDEENMPLVCNLLFDAGDLFCGELADPDHQRFCYGIFQENIMAARVALKARQLEVIQNLYEAIEKENRVRDLEWMDALKAQLASFLIMVRRFLGENEKLDLSMKSKEQLLVSSTIRFAMEQYSNSETTLEKIADSLYVSKSYLSKMFRQVTGEYFSDYIRSIRLKQACFLLEEAHYTNEEIVYLCGLKDISSFYRLFKKQFSMTPNQYRVMNKKKENKKP